MLRKKQSAVKIYRILELEYPSVTTALRHKTGWELLVATILSAQCTDKRVNIVTEELFKKYTKLEDYVNAVPSEFEKDIKSTGFYKNKTKNILASAKIIYKKCSGTVPNTMEELTSLPGVARKTANIILFHVFGKNEGIAVDTHVKRLTCRLQLTTHSNPVMIEKDLMELFEKSKWGKLSNLLIAHGRRICHARNPLCSNCSIREWCSSSAEL